ncbi:hypothetical protein JB92DRAFT_2926311 [Gautieria morchelliformis]|nr:hypothetical protein JB92DRAFT_2926311 [Gautieria morchelliformis]
MDVRISLMLLGPLFTLTLSTCAVNVTVVDSDPTIDSEYRDLVTPASGSAANPTTSLIPPSSTYDAPLESTSNTVVIAGCASGAVGVIVIFILGYLWWRDRRRVSQKYKTAVLERDTDKSCEGLSSGYSTPYHISVFLYPANRSGTTNTTSNIPGNAHHPASSPSPTRSSTGTRLSNMYGNATVSRALAFLARRPTAPPPYSV